MVFIVSLISFFILGYGIAFGNSAVGVVGAQGNFLGIYVADGYFHEREFMYYFATSLIVSIIFSGSMCERT